MPKGIQSSQFPQCPAGWSCAPPDFIGIAAQKAGTSWWFTLIEEHPQMYAPWGLMPKGVPDWYAKERCFFNRFCYTKYLPSHSEEYARWFPRPPGKITGEWTPYYYAMWWCPQLIRIAAPQAKILIMLRDPVDRYRSGLTLGLELDQRSREAVHDHAMFAHQLGFYYRYLKRFVEQLPKNNFLVLQYEKCILDPISELSRTFNFLGIDDIAATFDNEALQKLVVNETSKGTKVQLTPEQIDCLSADYQSDVNFLVELFPSIDLKLWPNFTQHFDQRTPQT